MRRKLLILSVAALMVALVGTSALPAFAQEERERELEERYEDYSVYDRDGDIGKVDDLFLDETDREEYIGVKMGLFVR